MTNHKIRDTVFCRYIGTKPHLPKLANALIVTQSIKLSKLLKLIKNNKNIDIYAYKCYNYHKAGDIYDPK